MDLEYLSGLWQSDDGGTHFVVSGDDLHESVRRSAEKQERQLKRRDWLELSIGMLCGVFFAANALIFLPAMMGTPWYSQWDWLLLAVGCFWVSGAFVRERREAARFAPQVDDDIRTTLQRQSESLRHQIGLLNRVAWWYVMPIALPLGIVTLRSFPSDWKLSYGITVFLFMAFIIVLNKWYAKRTLTPQLEANEQLLKEVS